MAENKMEQVESLLIWLASGEKDEDGNWLDDNDTQLVCDALEYYLNMHRQQNKMKQVAQMFGKKLGEEFKAKTQKQNVYSVYEFDEKGLLWHIDWDYGAVYKEHSNGMLVKLLTGEAKIVEE